MKRFQDFEYSTAALLLIGKAYLYYADLGLSLQPPSSLSMEEQDIYYEVLETQVYPKFYAE